MKRAWSKVCESARRHSQLFQNHGSSVSVCAQDLSVCAQDLEPKCLRPGPEEPEDSTSTRCPGIFLLFFTSVLNALHALQQHGA